MTRPPSRSVPVAEPRELFRRVAAGDFDEDTRRWLQAAAQLSLQSVEWLPLERWLRLPIGSLAQRWRRDDWLRRAYRLCTGDSARARAQALLREIDAFSRVAQHVSPEGVLAGVRLNDVRMAIFRAWSQGVPMPGSWRHLLRICDKTFVEMSRTTVVQSDIRPPIADKENVE